MKRIILILLAIIVLLPLWSEWEVGDIITDDYSWTDSEGDEHSFYSLTNVGKVVFLFWGETWCPYCGGSAGELAQWYPQQNHNQIYLATSTNWNNGLTYSEDLQGFYNDFGNGYIPFFVLVNGCEILYHTGNSLDEALAAVPEAIDMFNLPAVNNAVVDQNLEFGQQTIIDIYELFCCYSGPVNVSIANNSFPEGLAASLSGYNLILSGQQSLARSRITINGSNGTGNIDYSFWVSVTDNAPEVYTTSLTIPDTPSQQGEYGNQNPYDDSWEDLWWHNFYNENGGTITDVFVSGNLYSDSNPQQGSLWLSSPNREEVLLCDNFTSGTHGAGFAVDAFNGIDAGGYWTIFFRDSAGDGGHELTEGMIMFETEDIALPENPAVELDGIDDYLSVTGLPWPNGDMTMEAWVYPENFDDVQELIFGYNQEEETTFQFRINADGSILYGENPQWTFVCSHPNAIALNQWNHIAVTRENGICKLIANGVEVVSGEVNLNINPTQLSIGIRSYDLNRALNGKIDNIRIWNTSRSLQEINFYMNEPTMGYENGLVAAWSFDEAQGQTAADLTGNGYDLMFGQDMNEDSSDPIWVSGENYYPIPLAAYFGSDTNYGNAPLTVNFWDLSTGNPSIWYWDFDNDGNIDSFEQNPQWTYQTPGTYTISLTVGDGNISHSTYRVDYFHVMESEILPPAELTVSSYGLATWMPPAASIFNDDFEDYPAGSYLTVSGSDNWNTWDNNPGSSTDAVITTQQADSGMNSVLMEGSSDVMHALANGGYSMGHYRISTSVYVEEGYGAYFNVMHNYGEYNEWGAEVFLNSEENSFLKAEGQEYNFTFPVNQWVDYSFDIDLDNDWAEFSVAGATIHSWQWSLGAFTGGQGQNHLAAIDFFANPAAGFTPRFFFDDVHIEDLRETQQLESYSIYLNGNFLDTTDNNYYVFENLNTGENYTAGVAANYQNGSSDVIETQFTILEPAAEHALSFDGENDHLFCGRDNSLNIMESITLEAWINPAGWGEYPEIGFARIMDKKRYKLFLVDDGSQVGYNSNCLCFGLHCGEQSYTICTPDNSINLNEWQHVAATYDQTGDIHVYINGIEQVLSGEQPDCAIVESAEYDLIIGEADNYGRAYQGLMEEIRIWNVVRTHSEIQNSMNQSLASYPPSLAGYWKFNEGSGQLARDNSIYNNHGRVGYFYFTDEDDPTWIMSNFPFTAISADFSALETSGTAPFEVQFTDMSVGAIIEWNWDFDNNGTVDSYTQFPSYTYNEPGVYSVSLTVTDSQDNTAAIVKENYITVYPNWSVNPPSYEYNGTIWGVVVHEDLLIDHTDGILAAFVGDECRGIASLENGAVIDYTAVPQFSHVAFLPMLYSNETSGDILNFKYWDPYIGLYDISETIEFTSDMVVGSGLEPYLWHTTTAITIEKPIVPGWNWFSLNVAAEDMSINSVLGSIGNSGVIIKNQTHSATYYDGMGWFGSLNELNNTTLYKMEATTDAQLQVSGIPVNPAETPINLTAGWNWISYIPQQAEETNIALGALQYGNIIKNQVYNALYYDGMGWFGSLNTMQPLSGYMLQMNDAEELLYSIPQTPARSENEVDVFVLDKAGWVVNPHDFEFNGVVNIKLKADHPFDAMDYEVAIFSDDQCCGIAQILDFTQEFGGIFHSAMVYSNSSDSKELSIRIYDKANDMIHDSDTVINWYPDMVAGNFQEPLIIMLPQNGDNEIPVTRLVNCYPNPFNPETNISFELSEDAQVCIEVYNIKGQKTATVLKQYIAAGKHTVLWNASQQQSGIYFMRLSTPVKTFVQKIILLK